MSTMQLHSKLLSSAEEIQALAEALRKRDIIAFDTEFIRENTFYPVVEIIQIATDDESWLVDAAAFKKGFSAGSGPKSGYDPGIQPLLDVLKDTSILKIAHAAQGDQECIFTSFGTIASPCLDTAIAASLCGYGEGVGLGKLLSAVSGVTLKKGHARTNWSVRPLPPQLIEYAHADVDHLVELGRKLMMQLDELKRREWALELSKRFENPSLYEPTPEEITDKLARGGRLDKAGYTALLELVRWREARVRVINVPRRWVADDAVLADLAHVRPKDIAHLSAFRGLNKGELKTSGDAILAALKRGSEVSAEGDVKVPKHTRPDIPNSAETQVMELMKCYIGILADRHRIAAKHLVTSKQLLPVLRNRPESPEDFVKYDILTSSAAKLIGEELLAFLKGKRALQICGSKIQVLET
jgi:ribonuclease D